MIKEFTLIINKIANSTPSKQVSYLKLYIIAILIIVVIYREKINNNENARLTYDIRILNIRYNNLYIAKQKEIQDLNEKRILQHKETTKKVELLYEKIIKIKRK